MVLNAYGVRRLPKPYNHRTLIEQDDDYAFIQGDPSNTTDCTWFVLSLTADERRKFSSALLAGLDQLYPDDFINLYEKFWLQPSEFPNAIADNSCMDLCTLILDCINTDTDIQQAIANYSIGSNVPLDAPLDTGISGTDVLEGAGIVTCNNDNLFGATTGLVDLMNEIAEDLIEVLSNNSSVIGRVGDAIEGIPILGELPVDDILQLVENFVDDLEQLYQANYTVAVRDQYRCDLFCIAQGDCEITFEQIYDYFEGEFGSTVPTTSVEDFILWFATNSPANALIVPAWHLFIAGIMRFGGMVLDIDSGRLITMVSALYNDPDADWNVLCNCGTTADFVFDFETGNQSWIIFDKPTEPPRGIYTVSTGFEESWSEERYRCAPMYDFGSIQNIDRVDVDVYWELAGNTNVINLQKDWVQGVDVGSLVESVTVTGNGDQTFSFQTQFSSDKIDLNCAVGTQNQVGVTGEIIIKEVRVWLQ